MRSRNVNLTDHLDDFVAKQIDVGRYRNASEVMRAGLSLLEQKTLDDHQKLKVLRAMAAEGIADIEQGRSVSVVGEKQLRKVIGRLGQRASKQLSKRRRG